MDNPEETRRLREAFAATSPEDVATGDCPPAERIWEAVRNELGPEEVRQVLHHVASCPVCTESWRLASEIEGDESAPAASEPDRLERHRSRNWFRLTSAAAAVLAVVAIGVVLQQRSPGESIERSGAAEELTLVTESSSLTRSECRPQWVPIDGATYDVQILTESLELLHETTGLATPELLVPESALSGLPAEAALLLRIDARLPREMTRSKTLRLPC